MSFPQRAYFTFEGDRLTPAMGFKYDEIALHENMALFAHD